MNYESKRSRLLLTFSNFGIGYDLMVDATEATSFQLPTSPAICSHLLL